jgi:pyrroloquinoline quinone biosynthesis protein D
MLTSEMRPTGNPRLAGGVRLGFDHARGGPVLLAPESVTRLNDSGAAIVRLCDGTRSVDQITDELRAQWDDVDVKEVRAFINRLGALHCLRIQEPSSGELRPPPRGSPTS